MPQEPIQLQPIIERGLLVGVAFKGMPSLFSLEDSLDELARLAETAGVTVVGRMTQTLDRPNPATLIGKGKLEELVHRVKEEDIQVVIFDEELSPRQQREIEKAIADENVKVLDRTALILDIFAQHAHTKEGALQVELAQYEYRLPRLTRAWTHLARQAGGRAGGAAGGVGVRGPGETQLEIDRREIGRKIAQLKRELAEVRAHRERYRARRRESHLPLVALVGYTNAGKSTLLNALTPARVLAEDKLFATLDPTTRKMTLPSGREALITDTVGFIQKLPTDLVVAFRATLEEILEADLILHVADASHPNALGQALTVEEVLDELGAAHIPVVMAFNKIDLLPDGQLPAELREDYPDASAISALKRVGLDALLARIEAELIARMLPINVFIPYEQGELVDMFHTYGVVEKATHEADGVRIRGRLPATLIGRFESYEHRVPGGQFM
ncbi:MAG TPA: GTPase HflX [Caldilineae bacterium]|nr:GTPase HflX [Caldilineae bacterium]